jgi:hypothetical protein
MTVNEALRFVAGLFVLLSLLLGYYFTPYFYLFTGFVALNLVQSAFSHWCPMMWLLQKIGLQN